MQTHKIGINNISFKANYFTVEKKGQGYSLIKVSTDNEENLGQEPTLEFNSTVKNMNFLWLMMVNTIQHMSFLKQTSIEFL